MSEDQDATIVYERGAEVVEETVPNKHLVYFQDHWVLHAGEDDDGVRVRRIPRERVQYVERSVGEFGDEVSTLKNRAQTLADDLRDRLLGEGETHESHDEEEPTHINVAVK